MKEIGLQLASLIARIEIIVQDQPNEIRIKSFNLYEALFPNRRVISRDALHLIKYLRSEGYSVTVEPDDGTPLYFVSIKGLHLTLGIPAIIYLVNFSVNVLAGILGTWLYETFRDHPPESGPGILIEADDAGTRFRYDEYGNPISDERFQAILASMNERARSYRESIATQPPEPRRFVRINLEHTGRIVGWGGELVEDEVGLKVRNIRITDAETLARYERGELRGFSIAGLVSDATCSICNGQYVDCNHLSGREYSGSICYVTLNQFDLAEISIVEEPVNPKALINLHEE